MDVEALSVAESTDVPVPFEMPFDLSFELPFEMPFNVSGEIPLDSFDMPLERPLEMTFDMPFDMDFGTSLEKFDIHNRLPSPHTDPEPPTTESFSLTTIKQAMNIDFSDGLPQGRIGAHTPPPAPKRSAQSPTGKSPPPKRPMMGMIPTGDPEDEDGANDLGCESAGTKTKVTYSSKANKGRKGRAQ